MNTREAATALGTEPKVLRQFLRSDASGFEPVGAGGRYEFTTADIAKLKGKFAAWERSKSSDSKAKKESADPKPEVKATPAKAATPKAATA